MQIEENYLYYILYWHMPHIFTCFRMELGTNFYTYIHFFITFQLTYNLLFYDTFLYIILPCICMYKLHIFICNFNTHKLCVLCSYFHPSFILSCPLSTYLLFHSSLNIPPDFLIFIYTGFFFLRDRQAGLELDIQLKVTLSFGFPPHTPLR